MTAAPLVAPLLRRPAAAASGRLLAAASPDYQTHLNTHGAMPGLSGEQIRDQVELSGLTGRGGAGFPIARKLEAVSRAGSAGQAGGAGQADGVGRAGSAGRAGGVGRVGRPGGAAVIVANAAEGEPGSLKDRHLCLAAPHLILDGVQVAALITGATEAFILLRPEAGPAIRAALRERGAAGLDRLAVTVVEAAPGFVAGQETAVVSVLNGGPALPRFVPARVVSDGVHGRPTLVQNVETLSHLALVARYGGAWFAELGDIGGGSTGTFLATVHQPDERFGLGGSAARVWEVPHGLPLGRLLEAAVEPATGSASGSASESTSRSPAPTSLKAVLVGGFHGSWLRLPDAASAPLSRAGLAPFDGSLGAGVLMPLASNQCGLRATARIVRYLAAESAKQCGPCTFGLPHLAGLTAQLAAGNGGDTVIEQIRRTVGLVAGRGACHHPDGTARLVASALICFESDVRLHSFGRCLARIGEPYSGAA